jgi:hypothetical protein
MEIDCSLPCSKHSASCFHSEPDESILRPLFKVYFNTIILPDTFEYYLPTYVLAEQGPSFIEIFQSLFYMKIFRVLSLNIPFLRRMIVILKV